MRRLTLMVATFSLVVLALPVQAAESGVELHPVVVQLADDHSDPAGFAEEVVGRHGGTTGFIYQHAVQGFSARLPQLAIDALQRHPDVVAVSRDEVVVSITATDLDIPTGYDRIEAELVARTSVQTNVDIAILDTGVRLEHPDLYVYKATDCTSSLFGDCVANGSLDDGHGHGSHVAGTAAAIDNGTGTTGVASGARIWSVKVLDSEGNGYLSWLIAGVDVVTQYAGDIEVANMSLGGEFSDETFDSAIANSVNAGVFYAVAAGNSGKDAATFSPANHPDVMAVSAIADGDGLGGGLGAFACRDGESDDALATFSNFGSVVDIAAPGVCIYSSWNDDGYRMASGTSMASPHVAGSAALYIAEAGRDQDGNGVIDGNDVLAVRQALLSNAVPQGDACGFGGDSDGYAEPLLSLNTGLLGGGGCAMAEPDSTGPTAPQVTVSADGFNIDLGWTDSDDPESGVLSYVLTRDGTEIAEVDAHVTTYRDSGLAPATTYNYTVSPRNRQGVSGPASEGSATTSSDDPSQIGYFAFDDGIGTTATDSSGWRRHGTLVNGPVWSSGIDGGALQFDGSDDRVDLDPAVLNGADDVTAAFWIRTTNTGAQAVISAANSGNSNEYLVYLVDDTRLRLYVGTAETEGVEWEIPSIADGQWHHVTIVRNSGPEHAYLYLEGSYYGGWAVTKAMEPLEVSAALLGQDQDSVGGGFDANQALTGDLDELQLFDRVLSDSEIAALAEIVPNSSPVANADSSTTDEDNAVIIDVLANDTDDDGDVLSVESVTAPANGSVALNQDGTVTYTPVADFNGTDSFEYTVSDGNGGSDTATVSVTVNAVNDAPVASEDSYEVPEDTQLGVSAPGVLSNDSDVDGDDLTASLSAAPESGSLTLNADGSFSYMPDADFHGTDSFAYMASDGATSSSPTTVAITITPVNDSPVAGDDPVSTSEDNPVNFDVLVNDSDVDGDALSVDSVTQPANGTASIELDGTITYTPDPDFNGTDSFDYTVSDGKGGSDTGTVTVTVAAVNDEPVADAGVDQSVTVGDEVTLDGSGSFDVDGDVLSYSWSITSAPATSSASLNDSSAISPKFTPDVAGEYVIELVVNDGVVDSAPDSVTVSAADQVNNPPVASDDSYTVDEDAVLSVLAPGVIGNDSDVDGDHLSVASNTTPSNGSVSLNGDGSFTYTPNPNFNGSDSFTYTVTDGNGGSDTATVTVTVAAVNDAPVAGDDTATTQVDTSISIDVLANDSDVDGDSLSISSVTQPGNGTTSIEPDGTITYTPTSGFSGSDSFSYTISDGNGGSDSATVSMTVEAVSSVTQLAQSEMTVVGSRSGDLSDTHSADGIYEELSEVHQGGPPRNRVSELEHRWTFDIESGDSVSVTAVAHRSDTVEDDFAFEYSADGGASFEPLFTINSTTPSSYQADIPAGTSGQVIVRVVDTDRTAGNGDTDTIFVDLLVIETVNPQLSSGDTYEFRTISETTSRGSITSGDHTATHQADDVAEEISEELYAGGKKSRLEHTWTFDTSMSDLTFHIIADSSGNEGFTFAYSTDGSNWVNMTVAVDGTLQTVTLPTSVTGTIYVRVTDNDSSRGDSQADAILVDVMYFSAVS